MTNTLSAYLEQEIMSADPLELVCMLYQAAIMEVRDARRHLAAANVPARCAAISKVCDVISELLSSLNMEAGGEFSARLSGLYTYMLNRLVQANLQKSDQPLEEVLQLLLTLAEGWKAIVAEKRQPVAAARPMFHGQSPEVAAPQSWSF
jgi:flagellar protein FliS